MSQEGQQQTPLGETLLALRSQIESLVALRNAAPVEDEKLVHIYREEVTPNLMEVRRRQRMEVDQIESKLKKIRELNQDLVAIQERCDCVIYEEQCSKKEKEDIVMSVEDNSKSPLKNGCDPFDPSEIFEQDHETRMRSLEEEEARRKDLVERLNKLNEETTKIAQAKAQSASQIHEVIPYIRKLIEKVSPNMISNNQAPLDESHKPCGDESSTPIELDSPDTEKSLQNV